MNASSRIPEPIHTNKDRTKLHVQLEDMAIRSLAANVGSINGKAIYKALYQSGDEIAVLEAFPNPSEHFHTPSNDYSIATTDKRIYVTVQAQLESGLRKPR